MNTESSVPPRQRLKELLAIPDSQRTEAQWEEIIELEITLAPGNREDGSGRGLPRNPPAPGLSDKPGGGAKAKKPFKKFHKKPAKPTRP